MTWWMWILGYLAIVPPFTIALCMRLKRVAAPPPDEPMDASADGDRA